MIRLLRQASTFSTFTGPSIRVLVGPTKKLFHLHANAIAQVSPYFHKAFLGESDGVVREEFDLPQVDPQIFSHLVNWIYREPYEKIASENFLEEVKMWLLASRLGIVKLQNEVVKALSREPSAPEMLCSMPSCRSSCGVNRTVCGHGICGKCTGEYLLQGHHPPTATLSKPVLAEARRKDITSSGPRIKEEEVIQVRTSTSKTPVSIDLTAPESLGQGYVSKAQAVKMQTCFFCKQPHDPLFKSVVEAGHLSTTSSPSWNMLLQMARVVYKATEEHSPLRRLLVDVCAWRWIDREEMPDSTDPPLSFVGDLLNALIRKKSARRGHPPWKADASQYFISDGTASKKRKRPAVRTT